MRQFILSNRFNFLFFGVAVLLLGLVIFLNLPKIIAQIGVFLPLIGTMIDIRRKV